VAFDPRMHPLNCSLYRMPCVNVWARRKRSRCMRETGSRASGAAFNSRGTMLVAL